MKLDNRPGPAVPLSREEEQRLISSALDRAFEVKPRRKWLPIAAAAVVLLGAPAAVAAWMAARAPAPLVAPPAPKPKAKVVVPVEVPVEAPPPEAKTKKRKKREAEDLLAKANGLRRGSRWKDAEAVYVEVAERFPKSGSAYVALVAAASLRLEHLEDPRGSLVLLARAAKKKGPLDAEVLWNQSRAHRKLGDVKRERVAIERLIAEHPDAPFVEAAQARLQKL